MKGLSSRLIAKEFVPCSVSFTLTLTWGIDISFEKLTRETEEWIWKTLFALCFLGWGLHVKPELVSRQVNKLGVEGTMYVALS